MLVFNPTMASPTDQSPKISPVYWDIFYDYGFSKPDQKKALIQLLSDTGIDLPRTMDDLWIHTLIESTQKKWVRRTCGQDRWQVQHDRAHTKPLLKRVLKNLKILGFLGPIQPNIQKTDILCIFGARGPTMEKRIQYAEQLVCDGLNVGQFVLLAGERPVTIGIDDSENNLMNLAKKQGVMDSRHLTETHLIENIWNQSPLSQHNIPTITIDTPRGSLPRPTTQTTMLEFLIFLKKHPHVRHVTFISSQPHVAYQHALIDGILQLKGVTLSYTVVGQGYSPSFRKVLSILAELGSYLWAKTPHVLAKMNQSPGQLRTHGLSWHHLYAHNPLLNQNLPQYDGLEHSH